MVVTGNRGLVKVGYQKAAAIANWSLTPPNKEALRGTQLESILVANIIFLDVYWSTYRQFSIGLYMGKDRSGGDIWWTWDGVNTDGIACGTLTAAIVGNPIIRSNF